MNIRCRLGFHVWNGCKCEKCEKTRDAQHDWSKNCERCDNCSKERPNQHAWIGCKCAQCDAERHQWDEGFCEVCGARQKASVLLGPSLDGRGLGIQVKGKMHHYNANEARKVLGLLAQQFDSSGQPRNQTLYLATREGNVEIVAEDAVTIITTLGELAQNRMLFDLMAGM